LPTLPWEFIPLAGTTVTLPIQEERIHSSSIRTTAFSKLDQGLAVPQLSGLRIHPILSLATLQPVPVIPGPTITLNRIKATPQEQDSGSHSQEQFLVRPQATATTTASFQSSLSLGSLITTLRTQPRLAWSQRVFASVGHQRSQFQNRAHDQ